MRAGGDKEIEGARDCKERVMEVIFRQMLIMYI